MGTAWNAEVRNVSNANLNFIFILILGKFQVSYHSNLALNKQSPAGFKSAICAREKNDNAILH